MSTAAIILCGGLSKRMGQPKADLMFGSETMLGRCVRLFAEIATPRVVVAAVGQSLPELPGDVEVVRDEHPERGPLEGFATGLAAVAGRAKATWLIACDAPFVQPALFLALHAALEGYDAVIPLIDHESYPLTACYATSILPLVQSMRASNVRRARDLGVWLQTQWVDEAFCRQHDPDLRSFMNMNTPAHYTEALRLAGLLPTE